MILILCSPRTGSSLVSKIFEQHGCWIAHKPSTTGQYESYENDDIKELVKRYWDRAQGTKRFGELLDVNETLCNEFALELAYKVPSFSVWSYKTTVEPAPLFFQFNPKLIFIHRNEEAAIASMCKRRENPDFDQAKLIHRKRMDAMRQIEADRGGIWVDTDKLIDGDYTQIKKAIEYSELTFNSDLVDASINRKIWTVAQ